MKDKYINVRGSSPIPGIQTSSEKALFIAMITLAFSDMCIDLGSPSLDPNVLADYQSARRWLYEDPSEPLRSFSFAWMCQHLLESEASDDLRLEILRRVNRLKGAQVDRSSLLKRLGALVKDTQKEAA